MFWNLVTGPILLAAWREACIIGIGFLAGFGGFQLWLGAGRLATGRQPSSEHGLAQGCLARGHAAAG
jgi:hypothetical protein